MSNLLPDQAKILEKTLSNRSFQSQLRAGLPNRKAEPYDTDSKLGSRRNSRGASTLVLGTMHGVQKQLPTPRNPDEIREQQMRDVERRQLIAKRTASAMSDQVTGHYLSKDARQAQVNQMRMASFNLGFDDSKKQFQGAKDHYLTPHKTDDVIKNHADVAEQAAKIKSAIGQTSWEYAHAVRGGERGPGIEQTQAKHFRGESAGPKVMNRAEIRDQMAYLKSSHFDISVRNYGNMFKTTNQDVEQERDRAFKLKDQLSYRDNRTDGMSSRGSVRSYQSNMINDGDTIKAKMRQTNVPLGSAGLGLKAQSLAEKRRATTSYLDKVHSRDNTPLARGLREQLNLPAAGQTKDIFETFAKNEERTNDFFNITDEERQNRNNSTLMHATGGLVMDPIPEALDAKQRKMLSSCARRNSANLGIGGGFGSNMDVRRFVDKKTKDEQIQTKLNDFRRQMAESKMMAGKELPNQQQDVTTARLGLMRKTGMSFRESTPNMTPQRAGEPSRNLDLFGGSGSNTRNRQSNSLGRDFRTMSRVMMPQGNQDVKGPQLAKDYAERNSRYNQTKAADGQTSINFDAAAKRSGSREMSANGTRAGVSEQMEKYMVHDLDQIVEEQSTRGRRMKQLKYGGYIDIKLKGPAGGLTGIPTTSSRHFHDTSKLDGSLAQFLALHNMYKTGRDDGRSSRTQKALAIAHETVMTNHRRFARANQVAVKDGVLGLQSASTRLNPHYLSEMKERFDPHRMPGLSSTLTKQEISDIAGKGRAQHYYVQKQLNQGTVAAPVPVAALPSQDDGIDKKLTHLKRDTSALKARPVAGGQLSSRIVTPKQAEFLNTLKVEENRYKVQPAPLDGKDVKLKPQKIVQNLALNQFRKALDENLTQALKAGRSEARQRAIDVHEQRKASQKTQLDMSLIRSTLGSKEGRTRRRDQSSTTLAQTTKQGPGWLPALSGPASPRDFSTSRNHYSGAQAISFLSPRAGGILRANNDRGVHASGNASFLQAGSIYAMEPPALSNKTLMRKMMYEVSGAPRKGNPSNAKLQRKKTENSTVRSLQGSELMRGSRKAAQEQFKTANKQFMRWIQPARAPAN